MSQKVKLEVSVVRMNAYMASLDLAISLCMKEIAHVNAADHLAELRAEMMEAYFDQLAHG